MPLLMLAQEFADEYDPSLYEPVPFAPSPLEWFFGTAFSVLYFAFIIWMLVECLRKDPDRYLWMWLILLFQPFGAIIYFLVRWLPSNDLRAPRFLRKWFKSKEMHRLESAAAQIGNAYHHIQLGDALREAGQIDRAGTAYLRALEKEPKNLQALWGAALVDMEHHEFERARGRLEQVLEIDPQYKFGDVSLAYGRALGELARLDEARAHLEKHVRRWRQPEALYLLATLCVQQGAPRDARAHLEAMLLDIDGSPRAIARKQGMWRSKGRRLLRKLPRNA